MSDDAGCVNVRFSVAIQCKVNETSGKRMLRVRRFMKWVAAAIGILVVVCLVLFAVTLGCYFYASSKYQQITFDDTRGDIEDRKGLLSSRQVDRSFLEGYQYVSPFQELIADADNVIVGYSPFVVFFTVIYSKEGSVLASIDNGLDG